MKPTKESLERLIKENGDCIDADVSCELCLFSTRGKPEWVKCIANEREKNMNYRYNYRYEKAIIYYIHKYGEIELFKLLV